MLGGLELGIQQDYSTQVLSSSLTRGGFQGINFRRAGLD